MEFQFLDQKASKQLKIIEKHPKLANFKVRFPQVLTFSCKSSKAFQRRRICWRIFPLCMMAIIVAGWRMRRMRGTHDQCWNRRREWRVVNKYFMPKGKKLSRWIFHTRADFHHINLFLLSPHINKHHLIPMTNVNNKPIERTASEVNTQKKWNLLKKTIL